jgi:serine protease AprX
VGLLLALSVGLGGSIATAGVAGAATTYDPASDPYSMNAVTELTGAEAWWNAGYTGAGVDVAVIDTGVSPVAGLATAGKIVYGPDLSLESQAPNLRNLDTNGHGTFMAGLIAGKDTTLTTPYANAPASAYRGIAPDARIVSIKVGVADGGVDVSQVIAAIDWVVQHRNDNGLNIRVLNLSYGTNSTQDATIDPLAYAAEQAWKHGIVVVAAGGNSGFQNQMNNAPALANPANDRYVLAVGSAETQGTASLSDDAIPAFSPWPKRGATRSVDMIAPGTHLQGLRVPNSHTDVTYPTGRLGDRYFRGSGTSQSAALMSGAAALVLQKHPTATPDQVKKLLTSSAFDIGIVQQQAIGSGELQLTKTLTTALPTTTAAAQTWPASTGTGSLELARGADHLSDANGVTLTGEKDIFGKTFNSAAMATATAAGATWSGGTWNGSTWSGATWSGATWSGATWSGATWSGATWSGATWSGATWSGATWSGATWSGCSWSGATWSGATWSGSSWS